MKTLVKLFALVLTVSVSAQSSKQTQYAAYLTASKTMWEKSIEQSKKDHGENSFETAMAMYGLLNNTMATQDEETFDDYKSKTIDLLKDIIEENPNWGEPKAVLSSTYGLVMAYSPMKGMILGMKANNLMDAAMENQPGSPLVQKLYGGSKLYTPEMFGGNPEEAVKAFQKSIDLYESKSETSENWHYLDAMMRLAMSYRKTNQEAKAKATLEQAIAKEPKYSWAKAALKEMEKS
ncbi:MAG: hypothetical protein Tsb0034_10810 [Ekhidna sp.]